MIRNVVIFGASGHAKVIADAVEKAGHLSIVGIFDPKIPAGDMIGKYRSLGPDQHLLQLIKQYAIVGGIIGIGDNFSREKIADKIRHLVPEFKFFPVIHPSAIIGNDVAIGEGTVVMAGAIINAGTRIGSHCIINTGTSVDHDCSIGNFSSLAPATVLGGTVTVGTGAAIGIGTVVRHHLSIGDHCVIGAGSLVLKNTAAFTVSYGVPAKIIRSRLPSDPYLHGCP